MYLVDPRITTDPHDYQVSVCLIGTSNLFLFSITVATITEHIRAVAPHVESHKKVTKANLYSVSLQVLLFLLLLC